MKSRRNNRVNCCDFVLRPDWIVVVVATLVLVVGPDDHHRSIPCAFFVAIVDH